jgi:hypothetical protein
MLGAGLKGEGRNPEQWGGGVKGDDHWWKEN